MVVTIQFRDHTIIRYNDVDEIVHCENGMEKLHLKSSGDSIKIVAYPVDTIKSIVYEEV